MLKKGGEETEVWIESAWIGSSRAIGGPGREASMRPAPRIETETDGPTGREVLHEALMGGDIPQGLAIGNGHTLDEYI